GALNKRQEKQNPPEPRAPEPLLECRNRAVEASLDQVDRSETPAGLDATVGVITGRGDLRRLLGTPGRFVKSAGRGRGPGEPRARPDGCERRHAETLLDQVTLDRGDDLPKE